MNLIPIFSFPATSKLSDLINVFIAWSEVMFLLAHFFCDFGITDIIDFVRLGIQAFCIQNYFNWKLVNLMHLNISCCATKKIGAKNVGI